MRGLAVAIALGFLAACGQGEVAREPVARQLGLRTPDDVAPRTTAGAGTTGRVDGPMLEPLHVDGTTGTTAADPTTGSTAPSEAPAPARHSGTTGGAPTPRGEQLPA